MGVSFQNTSSPRGSWGKTSETYTDYQYQFLVPCQVSSELYACDLRTEGKVFREPKCRTPSRHTFPFHSFSTIIGVGVGAGAYILSRYAVRTKRPRIREHGRLIKRVLLAIVYLAGGQGSEWVELGEGMRPYPASDFPSFCCPSA